MKNENSKEYRKQLLEILEITDVGKQNQPLRDLAKEVGAQQPNARGTEFREKIVTNINQALQTLSMIEKCEIESRQSETEQNTTPTKREGIRGWIKRHPHSYGLISSFVLLTITLVVGLFNAQWRLWCWGTASLAFIVLILSLLGGKSR